MRDADLRIRVLTGTRPADALADLVFNMTFLLFQKALSHRKHRGQTIFDLCEEETTEVCPPTFMDDMTLLLDSDSTDKLLCDLAMAPPMMRELAAEYGLQLNLPPGKTEAIVARAGKSARTALAKLEWVPAQNGNGAVFLLPLATGGDVLRLVDRYNHLGLIAVPGRSESQAFAARAQDASATSAAINRQVLA